MIHPNSEGSGASGKAMRVYVLETGAYDEAGIEGVYATPEAAMAAWTPKPSREFRRYYLNQKPPSWAWTRHSQDGNWYFDADSRHIASVTAYEVLESVEVAS